MCRHRAHAAAVGTAQSSNSHISSLSDLEHCLSPPALEAFREDVEALLQIESNRLSPSRAAGDKAKTPWAPALGSYNMVVLGSPGVGRRKAAHVLAETLAKAGVLEDASVVHTRAQYLLHLYSRQAMVPLIQGACLRALRADVRSCCHDTR